ncbi:S66 family peptidase [Companilactobacillus ginsenosidimutans]|uniref:Peptidase S66 n=1 Tax=Companilactobacillus ginsenosidimutans TaxID=1007676 RepID=A0A0H4QII3_9LACO|nr:S66 peptidase family protein [Companilactobacillus ginsenosidimutans]AKP67752.1 peptidase S66 [Companilactobacillus ginsenosidimutans]
MNIGYFSSSTPITALSPKRFQRAKDFLESKNIHLIPGNLTGKVDFYRSGTITDRADEINQLIHNPDVDIIMSTIGGMNTNSILPYIDYEYLNEHPKTIVGYSDITALLLAIQTQCPNCRVLYGPALVASFGEWPPYADQTWDYLKKVLSSKGEPVTCHAPEFWTDESLNWENFKREKKQYKNKWGFINEPVLEGRIMGGNLDTMYGLLDSKYFPEFTEDDILFIEDAEKDAATVEKNFAMLKNAGILNRVKGIVLGKHALFDNYGTGRKPIDILNEVLNDPDKPIIYDYDSCHTVPMMTTPLGAHAKIDAENMTIGFSDF